MKTEVFFLFFLFFFSLEISAGVFKITSDIEIVTTDSSSLTQNASLQMKKYLEQILQKSIVVSNKVNRSKSSIILTHKKSDYASKLPFFKELSLLKEDSFIIENEDDNIIIAGSNHRALFYGVYHFLQRYMGCKFLTSDFEIIPKKVPHELINIRDVQIPRFIYREYFSSESDSLEFATKCRLNGRLGHRSADEYQDKNFPKGRAIYNQFVSSSLINDESYECNGQYDFSKNEVADLALESVSQKLSDMDIKKDDFILLEHEDRDSYCSNGLKNEIPGTPFLNYSAYIVENLKGKVQDTHVLYQAYQWSRKPPKKVELLPKHMSIFFSPIEADFSKSLADKVNQTILDDLKGWNRFDNDIFIWHYVTNFGGYFQPYPNLYALDSDIKLFDSLKHVQGLFLQSSYGTFGGELADLRTWVFSKLLWNPNLDINVLIGEFCDAYYGKASREVQKYIRVLHKFHQKMDEKLLVKSAINSKYLHQEFLTYLEEILDSGLKKVADQPKHKAHLLKLFSGIDYVRVMRGDSDKNLKKSKNRFKQFLSTTKGLEYFAEGAEIETIKKLIDIDRKNPLPPKEAKGLKEGIDWFDFQEYTLKLCCADLVSDIDSSDGVSAVMKGNLGDWGFQLDVLNFPKGKWDIYASVKVDFSKKLSLMDSGNVAFYFGLHPTFIKGAKLFGQCKDGVYQSVKIGTINTASTNAKTIWLSPPENSMVKSVYVDRLYIVKEKNTIKKEQ
jgi:hypothetical protein